MNNFFGKIGETAAFIFAGAGRLFFLFLHVGRIILSAFYHRKVIKSSHVFRHIVVMGVDSIVIIALVGASVGTVLALQAAYQLKQFGAVLYTGSLVSVSMARELGPLVAAILVTGRIGARMAAELGSMKVQEEVDALVTMGLNPVQYLVVPRCLALTVVVPCLTLITDLMGMLGGFLIGTLGVGINPYLYLAKNFDALVLKDIFSGLGKSVLFAMIIGLVSCHQGLSVEGGADAVGHATTQAVVKSIILIIVTDCLATAVLYYALPG